MEINFTDFDCLIDVTHDVSNFLPDPNEHIDHLIGEVFDNIDLFIFNFLAFHLDLDV